MVLEEELSAATLAALRQFMQEKAEDKSPDLVIADAKQQRPGQADLPVGVSASVHAAVEVLGDHVLSRVHAGLELGVQTHGVLGRAVRQVNHKKKRNKAATTCRS